MTTQGNFVEAALGSTETAETTVGTITLPSAGARHVVGIYGTATLQAATTAEGTAGYFRLSFGQTPGTFKFPLTIFNGPAGTLAGQGVNMAPQIIPVDIPFVGGDVVTCYTALDLAQTGTCRSRVGLIFE